MREGFIIESAEECAGVLAGVPGCHVLAVCVGETACGQMPEAIVVRAALAFLPKRLTPGAALIGGRGFRRLRLRNGSELLVRRSAGVERDVAGELFRYVWPCPSGRELAEAERMAVLPAVHDAGLIPHE